MNFRLKCKKCGAIQWVRVTEIDHETNSYSHDDPTDEDWEPESDCTHEDYEIIGQEDDDVEWRE